MVLPLKDTYERQLMRTLGWLVVINQLDKTMTSTVGFSPRRDVPIDSFTQISRSSFSVLGMLL